MKEVFRLAELGYGRTTPNPMVGAIVVNRGRIVGRGYHKKTGSPHAEIIAIRNAGRRSRGASLYVNLEPCCHFGKTPPCTEAIITAGIHKVIYSIDDPNPKVNGKGGIVLEKGGIQVESGLLETEATQLNQAYIKRARSGLPHVSVLIFQTIDGKIPPRAYGSIKLRRFGVEADAIVTMNSSQVRIQKRLSREKLSLPITVLRKGGTAARGFLGKLAEQGLNSVLLLGGELGGDFLKHGLVDRILYLIFPVLSGQITAFPKNLDSRKISDAIPVTELTKENAGSSIILSGVLNN